MLPSISDVYEQTAPRSPLTVMIGLSVVETQMLSELSGQAKIIAPTLGRQLRARIHQIYGSQLAMPGEIDLELYLQDWFLQLFHIRSDEFIQVTDTIHDLPPNLVMAGVDLILSFGYEICQQSQDPKGATRAFHKALAIKIASEQMQSQADAAQHFYELLLLD